MKKLVVATKKWITRHIVVDRWYIDFWWNNGNKLISVGFHPNWWRCRGGWFDAYTNGAKKGVDKCLDVNIHFCLFNFTYTNFSYNK